MASFRCMFAKFGQGNILYTTGVTVVFHQDNGMFVQTFCRYKSGLL